MTTIALFVVTIGCVIVALAAYAHYAVSRI
jgi:hypothetical protein